MALNLSSGLEALGGVDSLFEPELELPPRFSLEAGSPDRVGRLDSGNGAEGSIGGESTEGSP